MDDILVFTETLEEQHQIMSRVLKVLQDNHLCVKPEKCEFDKREIEFLGVIVGEGKIRMDPGKIQAISEWKTPRNPKELRSFLGFSNFYRRFIRDFARSSLCLTPLTGKRKWDWGEEQEEAFKELIRKLCEKPVLWMIQDEGKMKTEVDGSGFAMGAVLLQLQEEEWKTIAYMSATFNQAERNYHTEDRELLAIVKMLKQWRQYLLGRAFEIWTDHRNLQAFRKPQDINRRQAGWIPKLAEYDFTLHHIAGNKNIRADILSRKEGEENKKDDNKDQIILPDHLFHRAMKLIDEREKEGILK
jgi:hypothetical protein